MYDTIPTVLTPVELLDQVLGRASKIQKIDKEYFYRVKKTTLAKLESVSDVLTQKLDRWIKSFPNLERIGTYERELIDVVIGVAPLRRALSRLQGANETIGRVAADALGDARHARTKEPVFEAHRRFVGRAASVVRELEGPLAFLAEARAILHKIPDVTPDDPTIVVAGYPNVGKSSLLAVLTNAHPEIAPYAFTTKQVNVGHFKWPPKGLRARRYQVVDTPGLLEKPPKERNKIEQQAALALAFLADLILYVTDPSETCGYPRGQQASLMESVKKEFPGVPMIVVATKADLHNIQLPGVLRVSATTRAGLDELRNTILARLPEDPYASMLDTEPRLREETVPPDAEKMSRERTWKK